MRSKKVLVVVMALIACLVVGGLATEAIGKKKKKKIKVASSVTLTVTTTSTSGPYAPSSAPGTFSGNVTGAKKCGKARTVTILKNGNVLGAVVTSGTGNYLTTLQGAGSGTYSASVAKKKRKTKKAIIICKGTVSSPVPIK